MSMITLNEDQRTILSAVIAIAAATHDPATGEAIADRVEKNPNTLRAEMQQLKALGLVEGVPGPRGGYKPTVEAFRTLDTQSLDQVAVVSVTAEGTEIDAVVETIDFTAVNDGDRCRTTIAFRTLSAALQPGDTVTVGPTPKTGLTVTGRIETVTDGGESVALDVEHVRTEPRDEEETATTDAETMGVNATAD